MPWQAECLAHLRCKFRGGAGAFACVRRNFHSFFRTLL